MSLALPSSVFSFSTFSSQTLRISHHGSTTRAPIHAILPRSPRPIAPLSPPNKLHNSSKPHSSLRHPVRRPWVSLAHAHLLRYPLPPLWPPPSPPVASPAEDDLEHRASLLVLTHLRHSIDCHASKDERLTAVDDTCSNADRPRSIGGRGAYPSVGG
jgi:hypothetical protein